MSPNFRANSAENCSEIHSQFVKEFTKTTDMKTKLPETPAIREWNRVAIMTENSEIVETLNKLIEEIILIDGNDQEEFSHLRELINYLEQSISRQEKEHLLQSLELISNSENDKTIREAIDSFQESVDALRTYYLEAEDSVPASSTDQPEDSEESIDNPELVRDFLQEAEEYIQTAENHLIALEETPNDPARIDAIFRSFHTIKGVAGFLEFRDIHHLTHDFENLLEAIRNKTVEVTPETIDLILNGLDALRSLLEVVDQSVEAGKLLPHSVDLESLLKKVDEHLTGDIPVGVRDDDSAPEAEPDSDWESETESAPEDSVDAGQVEEVPAGKDAEEVMHDYLEDPELVRDFLQESEEHLQSVEQHIIVWEDEPDNPEHVDTIFRGFHTIKGVAGFLNLTDIQDLAHDFENLLDEVRGGRLELSKELIDLILVGIDSLRQMMEALDNSLSEDEHIPHEVDVDTLVKKVRGFQDHQGDRDREGADETVSDAATGKEENAAGDSKAESGPSSADKSAKRKASTGAIRVETEKMDHLIDMVGELVITQNMVAQNRMVREATDKRLLSDIAQLKRITSTLQNISMSLRMIPIKATFRKMKRIVRDLSRKSGKQIRLELQGEQTEIDRNMVEELYDPLVHMIRNSCDHGVEPPEERKSAGKPETGTITLNAYHQGGNVVIVVSDDGRGLSKDAIVQKAQERGLVTPDEEFTEKQAFDLLFRAGFSTAQQVTDVSGRGVGMDVVKRTIEKMRGQIDIESTQGEGTTFYINLPLTLAIIDGVIVRVGKERYVVPTLSIEQSVQPGEADYNYIAGKGETIKVRDQIFPLVRLHQLFDVETEVTDPWEGIVVLVDAGEERVGLLVDNLVDKQEVVIKSMGERLRSLPGISGGAILGDGTVGLILDISSLLSIRDAKNSKNGSNGQPVQSTNGQDMNPRPEAETT